MKRVLILIAGLFLFAAGPPRRPVIVTITPAQPVEIAAGTTVEYQLELNILKGFHIQANPASGEYYIPVTAKLQAVDGISIGDPVYPKGIPFRLKGSNRDISTYEGKIIIKIPIEVATTAKPGDTTLKGTLRYQGCDAELCFPPVTMPLETKLRIKK